MADIKFMDLSENDNPATTDSVLIGNQQDGLKRTTLGTIGKMFAVPKALHFEEVSVNANTADSQITDPKALTWGVSYSVQAPSVPGYSFVCWVNSATKGFICGSYIASSLYSSATVWLVDAPVSSIKDNQTSISAVAMYVKNELA